MDRGSPLRLAVDAADRAAPVLREVLPLHARRRGVVVLVHGRGPSSPWCPAEATLDAVVRGCLGAGVAARWDALGRAPAQPGALSQLAAPATDRRTLGLQVAGCPCELPRAWVGRHVVLVLPLVVDAAPTPGHDARGGPWRAALAALAAGAHARGVDDPVEVGAALLSEVFAGFTCVLDARRALLRARHAGARPRVTALDRVFIHGGTGLGAGAIVEVAAELDTWVQRRAGAGGLELFGACAGDPWPRRADEPLGIDGPLWPARPRARDREARRP